MPSLITDIRQLFSKTVLQRYERLAEANPDYKFNNGEIYISAFTEAMAIVDRNEYQEFNRDLLTYAQVFEQFVAYPIESIDPIIAGLVSASLHWLAGYSANAYVITNKIFDLQETWSEPASLLLKILSRRDLGKPDSSSTIDMLLADFILTGDEEKFEHAIRQANELRKQFLHIGSANDFVLTHLLVNVLERLRRISFWTAVKKNSSAPLEAWQKYIHYYLNAGTPIVDLWPSQRVAISKGLIDGISSVVIRMPTSSGKTRMTELAFVNDLSTDPQKRCLYLAPFRALVSEVENSIGHTLSQLGFPVASLYGGSEANEVELQLSNIARVIIATPEKIAAVLRLGGGSLKDFGTIILDEGHLIDSLQRGATYEMQLATLRPQLAQHNRAIFLSAVLPNSSELAEWLKGSIDFLADEEWQPTTMQIAVLSWPARGQAKLEYKIPTETEQHLTDNFCVPRLLEADNWSEINPNTGRPNKHSFPNKDDKGSIAAALAFQAIKFGNVIIYSMRPKWANAIAQKILERISLSRPLETNLIDEKNEEKLRSLSSYLRSVLGDDSLLPQSVEKGFALHHRGIPQSIRLILEDEFRNQTLRLLIATNTIAQGVNFPVRTVIAHSIPNNRIFDAPVRDFWNLAGRAGRALRETEGEVILLDEDSVDFIRQERENAESAILFVLTELIKRYQFVSDETVEALMQYAASANENDLPADERKVTHVPKIIRSIDAYLLEVIAEDATIDTDDENFKSLVENLFATYQARLIDERQGTRLKDGVVDLMRARRRYVLNKIPDGVTRKRYAITGLSVESAISLDTNSQDVQSIIENHPNFSQEAFNAVIDYIHLASELEQHDVERLKSLGYIWILTGRYDRVFDAGRANFDNFDDAVEYVERTLCYELPWILNGVGRLLEQIGDVPDWFKLIPDFLRYGVNQQILVWVLSLGFIDRRFAEWILEIYQSQNGTSPSNFRGLLQWILTNRQALSEQIDQTWPRYFRVLFEKVTDRYQRISDVLNQN